MPWATAICAGPVKSLADLAEALDSITEAPAEGGLKRSPTRLNRRMPPRVSRLNPSPVRLRLRWRRKVRTNPVAPGRARGPVRATAKARGPTSPPKRSDWP